VKSTASGFQSFPQGVDDPLFIRKLARLELGVDQLSVDGDLEAAASRGDQLQLLDLLLVGGEQFVRQTDGLRLVVSHRAVFEFDVHGQDLQKRPLLGPHV
jgi:hypothetical protein